MHNFCQCFENGMFFRRGPFCASSETILFIHGLGESGLCFEHIVKNHVFGTYNVLLPDLPGYGRSPWSGKEPLDLYGLADHLAASLSSPVIAVGHSMGGVVALLLAERHPQLVSRVIDIDGNKTSADCVFSSQALAMGREAFLEGGFDEMRNSIYNKGIDDTALRGYYVSLRLADPRSYYRHSDDLVKMSASGDLAGRLGKLQIPVSYIAGFPGGASEPSRKLLRESGVRLMDIKPSGHWPFIDQEDKFLLAMQESLSSA